MALPRPDAAEELGWIRRCQEGDGEAFRPLVEHHQRRVFSVVFHIVRRADQVEDLAQEVFIKAFTAIRNFDFRSSFASWLSRIAVNHCYDYLRRQRTSRLVYAWQMTEEGSRRLQAALEGLESGGLDAEERIALRDLTGKLLERAPADDRIVLGLKELDGLSVKEIAEILEVKTSTVKVRLHRARKRMLADLKTWQKLRKL